MNLLRFSIQCVIFLLVNCSIFLTMYYAHLANVNVGVITTIWAVQPLAGALMDKLLNDEPLHISHLVGIILVIISSLCISFKPAEVVISITESIIDFPKWPAILLGFLTPCFFLTSALFNKHLTQPSVGFDATTMSIGTSFVSSTLVLILGVSWYWQSVEKFDATLFGVGIIASILDTVGKVFIQRAFANGPCGPVAACVELNNVILVLIESARNGKVPHWLELVGFLFGISGGMVFVLPGQIWWFVKLIFCCGKK